MEQIKTSLNHIGIAVESHKNLKKLFELLGIVGNHSERVQDQGVDTHFLDLPPEPAHLEFLEPIDTTGPVAKFIQKRGKGVHHLSFLIEGESLDSVSNRLRSSGYKLTYDAPRLGAGGYEVNFIHPSCTDGVLIEIMSRPKG